MWRYIIKRLLLAIVTVFVVIAITFFAMHAIQGGPFDNEKASDPAVIQALTERYDLDKPLGEQFFIYLGRLFEGDLGISMRNGREISQTISNSFSVSAKVGGYSILVSLFFGLLLGMIAALRRNKASDRIIIFFTTLFQSVPSFVMATLLLLIFAQQLGWFPVYRADNPSYFLPVLSLSLYPIAYITRLTKSSMLDVLADDYIRTARAKGVAPTRVVYKHALRNAVLPVVTYLGPMVAYTLTGSMVVETVFTLPGLGKEFVQSVMNRDYTMIMGTTIFLATLMVFMTLLSDIVYKMVDPRITFD
ncbi:MAG: ABC transporter permease [Saccharofermentanales bacterium]|jgi:oligopeptide transport system permease protein